MKKMILGVIVWSIFLCAFSGVSARGDNNDFYDDHVFFTVGRSVFQGHFERSPHNGEVLYTHENWPYIILDIAFTKVFARNKSTGETELLFEMRRDIRDFYFIDGTFYLLTLEGIFTSMDEFKELWVRMEIYGQMGGSIMYHAILQKDIV